jgi:hypothetical protein
MLYRCLCLVCGAVLTHLPPEAELAGDLYRRLVQRHGERSPYCSAPRIGVEPVMKKDPPSEQIPG